jgi:hypothetical protein
MAAGSRELAGVAEADAFGRFTVDLASGAYDLVLAIDEPRAGMVLPTLELGDAPGEAERF